MKKLLPIIVTISLVLLSPLANAKTIYIHDYEFYVATQPPFTGDEYGEWISGTVADLKQNDTQVMVHKTIWHDDIVDVLAGPGEELEIDNTNSTVGWNYSHADCWVPGTEKYCPRDLDAVKNMTANVSQSNLAVFGIEDSLSTMINQYVYGIKLTSVVRRTGEMGYRPLQIQVVNYKTNWPNGWLCIDQLIYDTDLSTTNWTTFTTDIVTYCTYTDRQLNWTVLDDLEVRIMYACNLENACNETLIVDYVAVYAYIGGYWADYISFWETQVFPAGDSLKNVSMTCGRWHAVGEDYDDFQLDVWNSTTSAWNKLGDICLGKETHVDYSFNLTQHNIYNSIVRFRIWNVPDGLPLNTSIYYNRFVVFIHDPGAVVLPGETQNWLWVFVFFFIMGGLIMSAYTIKKSRSE